MIPLSKDALKNDLNMFSIFVGVYTEQIYQMFVIHLVAMLFVKKLNEKSLFCYLLLKTVIINQRLASKKRIYLKLVENVFCSLAH